jgi:hypothetical protein
MSLRPVFARAASALTRVGGELVTYQFRQGGPALTVRVVFSQPEEPVSIGMPRTGKASVRVAATVAASDLAPGRPERGDLIGLGSEKGWKVDGVEQDPSTAFYTLALLRQD